MHLLIVARNFGLGTPEGHQVEGFDMYRRELAAAGITSTTVGTETLDDVRAAVAGHPADAVFLMVSWKESPAVVEQLCAEINTAAYRPKLVIFLDYFAPTSSPYLGVLPHVDLYVKRQMLTAPGAYSARTYAGGNPLTEYVAESMGIPLDGWDFSSLADSTQERKIVPGWNLGVAPVYRRLINRSKYFPYPYRLRPIAVNCRIGLRANSPTNEEWYEAYRRRWTEMLAPLDRLYRCTTKNRVRRARYLVELLMSRIVISPFGWGEVCFRDYEAVAAGALLLKPSMKHLSTSPDIYQPLKTYVPLEWDGSDTVAACDYYLTHPKEAATIAANGRSALKQYFEGGGFTADIRRILASARENR